MPQEKEMKKCTQRHLLHTGMTAHYRIVVYRITIDICRETAVHTPGIPEVFLH
jgi:hypothetical protein